MMRERNGFEGLVALTMVALLMAMPFLSLPIAAEGYDTLILRTFKDGQYRSELDFDKAGNSTTGLELDSMSVVFNASLNATSGARTSGALDYPSDPYIDIGADGTKDWEYSGLGYGKWGLQDVFNDNSSIVNLTFEANDTREVRFKLPKGADVLGGSFTTGGWPVPYWGPDYVVSNTQTESKGESGPVLETFNGKMYEAWESSDPTITDGNDFDIVYRWFNGTNWSDPMDISPPGDFLEDDSPALIVFKDRLYCVWSASESLDFFAKDDIYLRSTDDGETWSPLKKVSPLIRNGMNDWPVLEVFQDKIFIFWKTMDPTIADVTSNNDMDIVYRWFDGVNFGPIDEITKNDDGAIDWSYDVTIYNNRLYVVWETDVSNWLGYQVDIMIKSYDGLSWSNRKNLSPSNDNTKDEIPRFYVWYDPVRRIDELYVIWGRGDGQADGSGDIDIVIRVFDGQKWSPIQEISKPNVKVQNMGHRLIGYEGRLYAIWIDGKESVIVGGNSNLVVFKIFGDIVIRSFDGYEWSKIKELTPTGQTDKASDPELCVFNGKLYATWAFPNDATASSDDWDIIIRNIDFQDVTLDIDIGKDGSVDWSGELSSSLQVIPLNKSQIESAMTGGSIIDDYDNEITEVAIRIASRYPSKISVHDLKIEYKYTIGFEFKDQLNRVLEAARPSEDDGRQQAPDYTDFPFEAGSSSKGKIIFDDLRVEYLVNYAPFLTREIPIIYMEEDTDLQNALDLEEYFSDDWDDGALKFRIIGVEDPNLLDVTLKGSWISLTTPTENWYGTSNITVTAMDGFDLSSSPYTIVVQVLPVNDPPILDFIPDQRLKVGDKFKYQAIATDVDGDELIFNDDSRSWDINKDNGVINFIPTNRGKSVAQISVSDGFGGEDHQNVTFIVEGENTSSAETSCFSLLAIVIIALAVFFIAVKLRHEFKWGPVAPERLRLDGDEDTNGQKKGVDTGGAVTKPGKGTFGVLKKSLRIPGTNSTYEDYDSNADGFLDDKEWVAAVEDIKRKRAQRRERLRAKAKALAKKKVDIDPLSKDEMKPFEEDPEVGAQGPAEEADPKDAPKYEFDLDHEEEYLPPGVRAALKKR